MSDPQPLRESRDEEILRRRVQDAVRRVDRRDFVPHALRRQAYADRALRIGHGQTISQPSLVALITQLVEPRASDRALDIGTGSGYQAALLAELVEMVYSIEIIEPLAEQAAQRLAALGYQNTQVRHGDGCEGWPDEAPFDVIVVSAASAQIPEPLLTQLALGGRLIMPVGTYDQHLVLVKKAADGTLSQRDVTSVAFVPLTGKARSRK